MLFISGFIWFGNSENQRLAQFHRLLNRSKYDRASLDDNLKPNMLKTARASLISSHNSSKTSTAEAKTFAGHIKSHLQATAPTLQVLKSRSIYADDMIESDKE